MSHGELLAGTDLRQGSRQASRVCAVIVNYNAAGVLSGCVESLKSEQIDEIIIVDNDSHDESEQMFGDSGMWLPNGANLGFGAGANRGAAATSCEWLLICNPDLILSPGAVKSLVQLLDDYPDVAIAGPRIDSPDGSVYPSPRHFPSISDGIGHAFLNAFFPRNRFTRRYRMLDLDRTCASADVDWVSGCCFLVRRDAWRQLGGFDESFFMYAEDVDLCWRARKLGWRIGFEPAARVTHKQGFSTNQRPYFCIVQHHKSLWIFSWRTISGSSRFLLPAIGCGLILHTLLACTKHFLRRLNASQAPVFEGQSQPSIASGNYASGTPARLASGPPLK